MKANVVNLDKIFGGGYNDFWRSKKRYVVCKGSKASKKSTSAALKIILKMIQYPLSNTLVIRKTLSSLKLHQSQAKFVTCEKNSERTLHSVADNFQSVGALLAEVKTLATRVALRLTALETPKAFRGVKIEDNKMKFYESTDTTVTALASVDLPEELYLTQSRLRAAAVII